MGRGKCQLPALTGMRFFLALWVAVYHQFPQGEGVRISWLPHAPHGAYCMLRTAYVAVGIFFVLSGFVLSYNYDLGARWSRAGMRRFWIARFSRIYPAYFLGLVLLVPFAVYRLQGSSSSGVGSEAGIAALNWALLQAWIPHLAQTWNFPGWSLSNEAFFYACFPLVGIPLWRVSRWRGMLAAAAGLWALCLLPAAGALFVSGFGKAPATADALPRSMEFWANLIRYNPMLRLPEFCAGILLGRGYRLFEESDRKWSGKGYLLYVPAALGMGLVLWHADSIPYAFVHNGLLLPFYAWLLFGLALNGGPARVLSCEALVFLGNASYSLYILHAPVASWMRMFWKYILGAPPEGGVFVLCYTGVVVAVSGLAFKVFEEPLHRCLRKRLSARFVEQDKSARTLMAGEGK